MPQRQQSQNSVSQKPTSVPKIVRASKTALSPKKASKAQPAAKPTQPQSVTTIPPAIALDALATVIPAPVSTGDVEAAKSLYLSLWFHPRCGGQPEAFFEGHIICEGCDYKRAATNGVALGSLLVDSEFETKIHHPTFLT